MTGHGHDRDSSRRLSRSASSADAAIAERLAPPDRRRGRGAATNASGRFEILARRGFRRRLDARGGAGAARHRSDLGEAEERHHPQRLARHLVRPLDQPVPRLRARLLLLLRPADPRLHGPFARPRFREQAVRQAGRGGAARARTGGAEIRARPDRARDQHRPLSADRAAVPHHALDPGDVAQDAATPRASSPSRTLCCATSTS